VLSRAPPAVCREPSSVGPSKASVSKMWSRTRSSCRLRHAVSAHGRSSCGRWATIAPAGSWRTRTTPPWPMSWPRSSATAPSPGSADADGPGRHPRPDRRVLRPLRVPVRRPGPAHPRRGREQGPCQWSPARRVTSLTLDGRALFGRRRGLREIQHPAGGRAPSLNGRALRPPARPVATRRPCGPRGRRRPDRPHRGILQSPGPKSPPAAQAGSAHRHMRVLSPCRVSRRP
jgi:hypothetical protein